MIRTAFHPAKIGDIIYSLPAVHRRGGVEVYYIKRPEVAEYLKPLLEAQPYIGSVECGKEPPEDCTIDFNAYQSLYRLMLRPDLINLNCLAAGVRTHHFPLKLSGITLHSKHVKYMDGQHIDLDKHRD